MVLSPCETKAPFGFSIHRQFTYQTKKFYLRWNRPTKNLEEFNEGIKDIAVRFGALDGVLELGRTQRSDDPAKLTCLSKVQGT